MKLRNKLAAITAAAMLAFTGVGFASWAFTKSVDAEVSYNDVGKVTAAIEAKDLTVEDGDGNAITGLYLICDAPKADDPMKRADTLPGKGIYWATDAQGVNEITELTLVGERTYDANDIADINTYVGHFAADAVAAVSDKTWISIAATSALDYNTPATTVATATVSKTWTLPAVSYKAIPASVADVDSLQAEVNALDITFSFTYNIASVA